jgi:hypothetical protein
MARVVADCRQFPSEKNCTLAISGEPEHVMLAAVAHAIKDHGHEDSPELREMIGRTLKLEATGEVEEAVKKSFKKPDERRAFKAHGYMDVVNLEGGVVMGRARLEPGWKWSNDVKPIAGTESCQAMHTSYVLRGKLTIRMDDGTEIKVQAGDAFQVPAGHDAWVEGDEPYEAIDLTGATFYAKEKEPERARAEAEMSQPSPV